MAAKIIFITGTDTGVGKTLLTALLLRHLRRQKIHALALKPFCSGPRDDVHLLQSLQNGELSQEEMNAFYFSEPLAPLAAKKSGQKISEKIVLNKISAIKKRCDLLLIEGSGGIMVPLTEHFLVANLIQKLACEVVLVARNKLGTINHTLLSLKALQTFGIKKVTIVLMGTESPDTSIYSNPKMIEKFAGSQPVFPLPFFGKKSSRKKAVKKIEKKIKKTLAQILNAGNFFHVLSNRKEKRLKK
ncbi:MAG: dethiobiotin synthase [Limisphaerales bacterium]